jgi:Na+-translocating ferredoxin:NAD+ oxidoreductase subunit B
MAYYIVETHVIDPDLCIDCGACGVVCPAEAIYDNFGNLTEMLKKNQRPYAFVDSKACTGCDKCAERCPFDCLHLQDTDDTQSPFFSVMTVEENKCTGCRECEKACPYDAIFVYRKDQIPEWLAPNVVQLQEKAA